MVNNFVPPKPGDLIMLLCMDCRMMFHGKNPGYGLSRLFSKTKCPQCKSKRIVPHPGVQY